MWSLSNGRNLNIQRLDDFLAQTQLSWMFADINPRQRTPIDIRARMKSLILVEFLQPFSFGSNPKTTAKADGDDHANQTANSPTRHTQLISAERLAMRSEFAAYSIHSAVPPTAEFRLRLA